MKRPQSARPPLPATPTRPKKASRRRGRKLAFVLSVVVAGAAVVSVGAAAYSRDGDHHDSAAGKAAAAEAAPAPVVKGPLVHDEELRGRAVDTGSTKAPGTGSVQPPALDASDLKPTAADAYRQIKIDLGALSIGHDSMGVTEVSLPLRVTNVGPQVRSFDITIAAKDAAGATITEDTGSAPSLAPGQSAEVRVLDLVNDAMAERLRAATFAVTDVFAY